MRRIVAIRICIQGAMRRSSLWVSGVVGSDTSASHKREYSCGSMRRLYLAAMVLLGGCPSDPPPACTTTTIDLSCAPQYVPTFTNVYENTLKMDCGSGRNSCHSASGDGDMSLADPDIAFNSLLDGRVVPGDPTCSELIVRTHDVGTSYQMPPGGAISAAEQCALVQWVAAGAQR